MEIQNLFMIKYNKIIEQSCKFLKQDNILKIFYSKTVNLNTTNVYGFNFIDFDKIINKIKTKCNLENKQLIII